MSNKSISLELVSMQKLPMDLVKYILLFAPIISPPSKCIKRLIDVYNEEHNWYLTKQYRMYYIKNILTFEVYYWWSRDHPDEFMLGPSEYDNFDEYNNY